MTNFPVQQQVIRAKCIHPTGLHTAFERDEIEQSIPGRFEKQVAKYPDRLAVKTRCYNLTYMALNQTANRLAHTVRAQHTRGGEPIALLLGHDAPLIAAMLAVLKTGKGYVALESCLSSAPAHRYACRCPGCTHRD